MTPHLETFQTGYFSYVFLSMAFFNYAGAGLGSFANKLVPPWKRLFLYPAKIPLTPFAKGGGFTPLFVKGAGRDLFAANSL